MAKCLALIALVSLLAATSCNRTGPKMLKTGMSMNSAIDLLEREGIKVEDVTGSQLYSRTFRVSSPTSADSLCFDAEVRKVTKIFWYRNWRADYGKPKNAQGKELVFVDAVTLEEIRAGLDEKAGQVP